MVVKMNTNTAFLLAFLALTAAVFSAALINCNNRLRTEGGEVIECKGGVAYYMYRGDLVPAFNTDSTVKLCNNK